MTRRDFMGWLTALTGLLGTQGCTRQPLDKMVPYSRMPEEIVPGQPLFYATCYSSRAESQGILVESHLGRPTKIEGNDLHPSSLGATDAWMQASILDLYDPDRSRSPLRGDRIATWSEFMAHLNEAVEEAAAQGKSAGLLTREVISPTLADQIRRALAKHRHLQWYHYDPISRDNARSGSRLALGREYDTLYDFSKADVILSLDSDFLTWMPGHLRYAREFTDRRRVEKTGGTMNRLYVIEATPSLVGSMADHRLPLRPSLIPSYTFALARELGIGENTKSSRPSLSPLHAKWIAAVARDLLAHPGRAMVVVGESQPAFLHALGQMINERLGAFGHTVRHIDPIAEQPTSSRVSSIDSLTRLTGEMRDGRIGALLLLGANPVYDAPVDLDFSGALRNVPYTAHLGLYHDETAIACQWHVPEAHYLESWGDARAFDGTVSIQQPLIEPLFGGKSVIEIVSVLLGPPNVGSYEAVKAYWRIQRGGVHFEKDWRRWLHDGIIPDTAMPISKARVTGPLPTEPTIVAKGLELVFRPDSGTWDGRFSNNGWLQELPRPLTKLTWGNAALVSPDTARRLQISNEDIVELTAAERRILVPIWILPGQPDETVTLTLGYGRMATGRLANGLGYDAYRVRVRDGLWSLAETALHKTGKKGDLVSVQTHHSMEGRDIARGGDIDVYHKNARQLVAQKRASGRAFEPSLRSDPTRFPPPDNSGTDYQWGMSVNLNTCIGCEACVVACQSENNIPIVGQDQVQRGREMHWLRIDNYFEGPPSDPRVYFQPVPCMHCETAPCELVCPVGATLHSHEGLNQMVYNRCVGTRYCSNNCPYKVRRFNFYNYKDPRPIIHLMRNPDVTVRERGVMEKCTYCVQRINHHRIEAEKQGRAIRDGEFTTACAQACPTRAIVFGNVKDENADVARLKAFPLDYSLLEDLNTKPRTTYLGKLWNPNPELKGFTNG